MYLYIYKKFSNLHLLRNSTLTDYNVDFYVWVPDLDDRILESKW